MMRKIKTISKRMIGFLYMILIMLLINGYGRINAQPVSGIWNAPTDFGNFSFTVNEDGSLITQFIFDVSDWQCANVSGSWITTITWTLPNTGCPISNNTFSYQSSSPQEIWDVAGTFNQSGNQASGTWSYTVAGGICDGTWGPIVKTTQTVIPPGDVSGTWTLAGSPYLIDGEITVPDGETLTIEPGVLVEFQGHYKLNVQGRLLAVGTENDSIVFTINDTTGFSNPDIPDGGWSGIRFWVTPSTNDTSKIDYCKLQYGKALGDHPHDLGGAVWISYFNKLILSNSLITNNYANYSGGGIAIAHCSPKIIGNTISYNSASQGGGIDFSEECSPQIVDNIIVNNSATQGGGIICREASPVLTNTIIENNNSIDNGGGIWSLNYSRLTLENVSITGNRASSGGGISTWNSDLIIDGSSFINNEALSGSGGAINFDCFNAATFAYQCNVTNSIFTNNIAAGSAGGIIVVQEDSAEVNVIVDKCFITNNLASSISALRLKGRYLNFTLKNSIITGNEAKDQASGAMFNRCTGAVSNCLFATNNVDTVGEFYSLGSVVVWEGANVDFMNCTFADNSASYGAGLFVGYGGNVTTTNCIFWGNSTSQIALYTFEGYGGTLIVNYCDIQGGADSVNVNDSLSTLIWGENNMDADPLFVDQASGDFHIRELSPCNGAGIDKIEIEGVWLAAADTDIEGNQCPNPAGTMPDIGAYEAPFDPVGIEDELNGLPEKYSLSQNYPNPFNPATTIKYSIPSSNSSLLGGAGGGLRTVTLKVYNILGKEIATLVNKEQRHGYYEVKWDASALTSGVYFYKLTAGSYMDTKKMLLLK